MVDLVIDVRERGLIELLNGQIEFETRALDLGDILFEKTILQCWLSKERLLQT